MLDVYDFHTNPKSLVNYQENVVRVAWFKNMRTILEDAIEEVNGGLEVMHGDNPNEELSFISLDYRVGDNLVKLYTTGGKYVGYIERQYNMFVFFNTDGEEFCSIDTNAGSDYNNMDALFTYICALFDIDPEELY